MAVRRNNMDNLVKASANSVRISPRKMGLVASLVRGRTVEDALVILEHTPKRPALVVSKTIASAKANAINNHGLKEAGLTIHEIQVGPGPRLKRFRPVARGMAHGYMHRTSHLSVTLVGAKKEVKKSNKATTTTKAKIKETK